LLAKPVPELLFATSSLWSIAESMSDVVAGAVRRGVETDAN
jgi:hypothetical protein